MNNVIGFPSAHARASAGQRSGLNSLRETPVSRSIKETNSAGTPRLDLKSQYQTWDCVVPIRSAKAFCPPAASHARLSASLVMEAEYPLLGHLQPKNLWRTDYRLFGKMPRMKEPIDPVEFGRRVRELRDEKRWSQTKLAKVSGYSQTNIGWIEGGGQKDPTKQAIRLAEALETTPEWLLHGTGERRTPLRAMSADEFRDVYRDLAPEAQEILTKMALERRKEIEPAQFRKAK